MRGTSTLRSCGRCSTARGPVGLIAALAQEVPQIRVRCVAGNHGRAGRPGQFHPVTNFDTFVYALLARRLSGQPSMWVEV